MEQPREYTDEIDLGKYIATLIRQWRLILFSTLICAIVAYASTSTQPIRYAATALVATTRSSSDVSFGSKIDTVSESDLNAYRFVDRKARMNTFVELVNNPLVAEAVVEELGDQLNAGQQDPRVLIRSVNGSLLPNTDSIAINVTHKDPVLAAAIVNAWADAYVYQINELYSEGDGGASFQSIQDQVVEAKTAYDAAQEVYTAFEKENRIAELNRQINEQQILIENLSTARNDVYNLYITDLTSTLDLTFKDARRIDKLILDAQGMLNQVTSGGAGAAESNIIALTMLKNQAFAANESFTNLTIQTTPISMTVQEMVNDIKGLITALEDKRVSLDEEIITLSEQLLVMESSDGGRVLGSEIKDNQLEIYINELEEEVRLLQSQLAEEKDLQNELERARKLAWDTYSNLATWTAQLGIASQNTGKEMAVAIPATVPLNPIATSQKTGLIGAAAGFAVGVALAYLIEFWWSYKGLEPQAITVSFLFRETKQAFTKKKDKNTPQEPSQ